MSSTATRVCQPLTRPSRSPVKIHGTAEGSTIIVSFDQRLNERTKGHGQTRLTTTPLRFAAISWVEDLHLQAVDRARHTKKGGIAAALSAVG
ncbi:hypothetical protein [Mesorhizobium sp. M0968]|uniref:hypothetical protein n=1 Tax=Mesorhizobium sp. M0968 TaxID=2957037 RepID=UPI0033391594